MGCKMRLIKKRANHSSDNRWQCRLRKTHFLFFSLLPGISSFKGMGGNNNPLLLCGVHQESEVKPITSFQLRLIFFPAFFFFFAIILGICVKISYLEVTLNPTVTNANRKVVFLILCLYAGI